MPRLLHFKDFEFVHGPFLLPENVYIFRTENKHHKAPPNFPMFFGDIETGTLYKKLFPQRILKAYVFKKHIRVLDIRYIQAILPFLWGTITSPKEIDIMKKTSLALGLTSFNKQVELLYEIYNNASDYDKNILKTYVDTMVTFRDSPTKPKWVNPVEVQGMRFSITHIDYMVVGFLKALFGDIVDGIIAPALHNPIYESSSSRFYQEIIIFDPLSCVTEIISDDGQLQLENPGIQLAEYVKNKLRVLTPATSVSRFSFITGGSRFRKKSGGYNHIISVPDEFGEVIGSGDKTALSMYSSFVKDSTKLVDRMIKSQIFMQYYCPNTCSFGDPSPAKESRNTYITLN